MNECKGNREYNIVLENKISTQVVYAWISDFFCLYSHCLWNKFGRNNCSISVMATTGIIMEME